MWRRTKLNKRQAKLVITMAQHYADIIHINKNNPPYLGRTAIRLEMEHSQLINHIKRELGITRKDV